MTVLRARAVAALALAVLGGFALVGCSPSEEVGGDGPTEESVALLDEFFAHLEAGEPAEAAALTDVDFAPELIDEGFYAASAATPADARVVEASGSDAYAVTATVEYVLDDPAHPVTATYRVTNTDGERTVSWDSADGFSLIMVGSPGRIVLNGEVDFGMSLDAHRLTLLPGVYEFAYVDPTGTTRLDADGTNEFTIAYPVEEEPAASALPEHVRLSSWNVSVNAFVGSDVIDAVETEIRRLTVACTDEALAGPSCPPAVLEYGRPLVDPSTVEWFEDVKESGIEVHDGVVKYSMGFTVRADDTTYPMTAVYEGTVTRSEDGSVTYTRG